jgi:RimJ/RimL family protein N-acetyltransferase
MPPAERIETTRLLLRSWRVDDAEALREVFGVSRAALERWTPWVLYASGTIDGLREKLRGYADNFASGVEWRYAMLARDDGRIVGGVSLHPRVGPGAIEIGYWLATTATGHGFATEAAQALTVEALRMPGIERVEIRCDPANDASMRVPERLGYRARTALVHEPPTPSRPAADVVVWERSAGDARGNARVAAR